MIWLKVLPWALVIAGCLTAYAMFKRVQKLKVENQNLRVANAHYLKNMQMLKESEVTDVQSQVQLNKLTAKVREAKTDEEAVIVRRDIVDSILVGLQNL